MLGNCGRQLDTTTPLQGFSSQLGASALYCEFFPMNCHAPTPHWRCWRPSPDDALDEPLHGGTGSCRITTRSYPSKTGSAWLSKSLFFKISTFVNFLFFFLKFSDFVLGFLKTSLFENQSIILYKP